MCCKLPHVISRTLSALKSSPGGMTFIAGTERP
jgi:hypothetical protein